MSASAACTPCVATGLSAKIVLLLIAVAAMVIASAFHLIRTNGNVKRSPSWHLGPMIQTNDNFVEESPSWQLGPTGHVIRTNDSFDEESPSSQLGPTGHSPVKLVYKSSDWELEWIRDIASLADNSPKWLKGCARLSLERSKIDEYMSHWRSHAHSASPSQRWDNQDVLSYFSIVDGTTGNEVGQLPIEPLVGALRHPRWPCFGTPDQSKDWLFTSWSADREIQYHGGRALYFDIGCSTYRTSVAYESSLSWFWRVYKDRGIYFDEVVAWEPDAYTREQITRGMPEDMLARFTVFQRYASAEIGDPLNPWQTIREKARKGDFVVVKLDMDTPRIENRLVDELIASEDLHELVDEFFYEHHVKGNPLTRTGWAISLRGSNVTINDSYSIFKALREKGIRAHSWI